MIQDITLTQIQVQDTMIKALHYLTNIGVDILVLFTISLVEGLQHTLR